QGGAADARGDEGKHGRADPPLQALQRGHVRSAGRGVRRGGAPEGGVRHLPHVRRREQAVAHEDPRSRLRAPRGHGRDGEGPHDRGRGGDHRHHGHRIRRDRPMRSKALAALAFVAAAGALAQAPSPAPADPMRLAEAKALVNSMHMDQTMGSAVTQGMSGMLAQMNPRRDPRIAKIAMEEAVAQMREDASRPGGMYDQLADFYASEFTVEEMKQ